MKETIVFAATLLETLTVSFLYWSDMALQEGTEEIKLEKPIVAKENIRKTNNIPITPLSSKKKSLVKIHLQAKKRSILHPT